MDAVARAIGDAGGARRCFDAGDDTSTGKSWEAFSLDSLDAAFEDLDRWGVAGNHDHGSFVRRYLADRGWTMLDGEPGRGPAGTRCSASTTRAPAGWAAGATSPGFSFAEVGDRLADGACDATRRSPRCWCTTPTSAAEALRRGCADLVLGGHLHVQVGPDPGRRRERRASGYSYTNGTTGGAAYAIAVGSKPRRPRRGAPWSPTATAARWASSRWSCRPTATSRSALPAAPPRRDRAPPPGPGPTEP